MSSSYPSSYPSSNQPSSDQPLTALAVPPRREPTAALLVILHGWGANAQDVAALASFLQLPTVYFLFPDAPFPHPYAPGGRMWYDLEMDYTFTSQPDFQDQPELKTSRSHLRDWLMGLEATTGIPLSRTILGGFSQGGAMTLDVGLQLPIAALMVLSGYLHAPIASSINPATAASSQSHPPVLLVHGRQDLVVPVQAARQTRDTLIQTGISVQYQELDMGHEIPPLVLSQMQSFVEEVLASLNEPDKPL